MKLYGEGGASSGGGGDSEGILIRPIVKAVINTIREAGKNIYPEGLYIELLRIESNIKIIMTDEDIKIDVLGETQDSDAFSARYQDQYYLFINNKSWNRITDVLEKETLIHHELMVLMELETTGDYTYTEKYKDFRRNYWRYRNVDRNICNINLFEKMGDSDYIGKMVGSDAISVSGVTSGEMGIIKKLNKKEAIIWRGVIDSVGYMRLQIEKASFYKKPADMIDLGTVQLLEPMRIYSDPYDFNGQSTKTIKGDHFWINVTCNQH